MIAAETPLGRIEEYTKYAGRMPAPPMWARRGAIVGYEGGTAAVLDLYNKLIAAKVAVAAFWLQDWTGLRIDEFGARLWCVRPTIQAVLSKL